MSTKAGALLLFPGAGSAASHPSLVAIEGAVAPLPDGARRLPVPPRRAARPPTGRRSSSPACSRRPGCWRSAPASPRRPSCWAGGRWAGGSARWRWPTACPPPASSSSPIRCTRRASPTASASSTSPKLAVPCLFVSGTRDAFGSPDELEAHRRRSRARSSTCGSTAQGHDLKGADAEIASVVSEWVGRSGIATAARRQGRVLGVELLELLAGGLRVGHQHEDRHQQRAEREQEQRPGRGRPSGPTATRPRAGR